MLSRDGLQSALGWFVLAGVGGFILLYAPGPIVRQWDIWRARRRLRGKLVLTYDDGPGSVCPTPMILDLLRRYGARATFFLHGSRAVQATNTCERLVAEGHEVGAHGYEHIHGWKHPLAAARDLVRGFRATSRWRSGPLVYRQPYGKSTLLTFAVAAHFRASAVWWTVDSGDTWEQTPDCASIVRRVELDQGGIVLMHDFPRDVTAAQVQFTLNLSRSLLELAACRGWRVCTASEALGIPAVARG